MDCWQENYYFEALHEALPALTLELELMVLELLYWFRFRASLCWVFQIAA